MGATDGRSITPRLVFRLADAGVGHSERRFRAQSAQSDDGWASHHYGLCLEWDGDDCWRVHAAGLCHGDGADRLVLGIRRSNDSSSKGVTIHADRRVKYINAAVREYKWIDNVDERGDGSVMMTEPHLVVRNARITDLDDVLALCRLAYDELPCGRSLNAEKVRAMVLASLDQDGLLGVVACDGRIIGMTGLVISSAWYSDDPELHDWLTFVHPGARQSDCFNALIMFAKQRANQLGIPLWLGFVGRDRASAKQRVYQRHADAFGSFYRYSPIKAA